jgi:hypothetical protein
MVAENVTSDSGFAFVEADSPAAVIALTNCLITSQSITNGADNGGQWADLVTNSVVYLPSLYGPVYQVAGGGNYYLASGSPFRTNGNANIDPALLADLAKKTTWPPIVYDVTNVSSLGILNMTAQRDTNNLPDIGYHYDPLDYVFGGCDLFSNLTIGTGTAIGWFEDNGTESGIGNSYGMSLNDGSSVSFNGIATQPCYLVPFRQVQEGGNSNWSNVGWNLGLVYNGDGAGQEPSISANFTIATATYGVNTLQDRWAYGSGTFNNCEFYDAALTAFSQQSLDFTNCLFFRTPVSFWGSGYDLSFIFENCTFYGGGLSLVRSGQNSSFWQMQNSSFDGTAIWWSDADNGDPNDTLFDYNAYNINNVGWQTYPLGNPATNVLETVSPMDVMVTNYNWETSWFGNFYLSPDSPLLFAGSTNANCLGLFFFTTQTNQFIEGNTIVDIGYHYVATDGYGNPLSTYGDGIPDYLNNQYEMPPEFVIWPGSPPVLMLSISDSDGDGMTDALKTELGRSVTVPSPEYIWFTPVH